jgi:curved DNA-binding protein CbpA
MVMVMAAAAPGGPDPDLYQLLGVPCGASREEIALAWRRRARAEHPDARPGDAAAAARFRALAQAWQVLGDPARRAAYDQVLRRDEPPPAPPAWAAAPVGGTPVMGTPEPPLRAGPVLVEHPGGAARPPGRDEEAIRVVVLTRLALGYPARQRGRRW